MENKIEDTIVEKKTFKFRNSFILILITLIIASMVILPYLLVNQHIKEKFIENFDDNIANSHAIDRYIANKLILALDQGLNKEDVYFKNDSYKIYFSDKINHLTNISGTRMDILDKLSALDHSSEEMPFFAAGSLSDVVKIRTFKKHGKYASSEFLEDMLNDRLGRNKKDAVNEENYYEDGDPELSIAVKNQLDSKAAKQNSYDFILYKDTAVNIETVLAEVNTINRYNPYEYYSASIDQLSESLALALMFLFLLGILIAAAVSLCLNYQAWKDVAIIKVFNKSFVEFKYILLPAIMVMCLAFTMEAANSYSLTNYTGLSGISELVNPSVFLIVPAIIISSLFYLYTMLVFMSFKHMIKKGFVEGFVHNTLTYRAFTALGKIINKIYDKIKSKFDNSKLSLVNIKSKEHIILITVLATSSFLLLVLLLSILSGSMPVIAFVLFISIPLFAYIYFRMYALINSLIYLDSISGKMSEGDFSESINENLGMLSSLAKNFNNIGAGLDKAIDEAVKSQNMKTELITNVSHDLKTPLTSIINYSDLLNDKNLAPDKSLEYSAIIHEKALRLKTLIENLFDISKANSGDMDMNLEDLDLVSLLHQTIGESNEVFKNNDLQLITNIPFDKIVLNIDGEKTHRVFENIMGNLEKYSLKGTRVYIDVRKELNKYIIEFKNISNYQMNFDSEKIFERFARGDKSRNSEGSGLGLAITKTLMQLMGGDAQIVIDGDLFKVVLKFKALD